MVNLYRFELGFAKFGDSTKPLRLQDLLTSQVGNVDKISSLQLREQYSRQNRLVVRLKSSSSFQNLSQGLNVHILGLHQIYEGQNLVISDFELQSDALIFDILIAVLDHSVAH